MARNPYTILFGKQPLTFIPRDRQRADVLDEFTDDIINEQAYVIVGVRGSGKTVFMTDIAEHLEEHKDWIVVDLNAQRNMLEDFVSVLSSRNELARIFREANINLSYFGFGLSINGVEPIKNIQYAGSRMLSSLKKHNKRVLITIDEVRNSEHMKEFVLAFQSYIREKQPIFLLATGIYENVLELEDDKQNTFFARAPKIEMSPLRFQDIKKNYQETFSLSDDEAEEMARMTKGYSFAFQVLGHYTWQQDGDFHKAELQYRRYIFKNSYRRIWKSFSQMDKVLSYGIARSKSGKVSEIREIIQWESNKISPYRKRLSDYGVIDTGNYGHISFVLPSFSEFVIEEYEDEVNLF